MKVIFLLTTLLVCFIGYSQTGSKKNIYRTNAYTIQYPDYWLIDSSRIMGPDLGLFSPLEDDKDKFAENVNVLIQDLTGKNIDLEKYKEITEKQTIAMGPDAKILEAEIIQTDIGSYLKMITTIKFGEFHLKSASVCFIENDKAYLATFTAELHKYEIYKAVGETILASFHLNK